MITLYDMPASGNSYKVRLAAAHLGVPLKRVTMSARDGSTRQAAFLAKNPIGKLPTVELEDGRFLAESNAIMLYLAEDGSLVPADRYERAKVYEWLFFEQYSHEPYVATPRWILRHLGRDHPRIAELPDRLEKGRAALGVMEGHLQKTPFFVGGRYSIADIALYAYTHRADEADLDLKPFPAIRAWMGRVADQPGHVKMLPGD